LPLLALLVVLFGLVGLILSGGIFHFLARTFGGTGSYVGLLSGLGFANLPAIFGAPLALLSLAGGLSTQLIYGLGLAALSLWTAVLGVIALRESHSLSTARAVATYLIPGAVILVISLVIGLLVLAAR
jgi:hypothetical protein